MQQRLGDITGVNLGYVRDWWLVDTSLVLDVPRPRPNWNGLLPPGAVLLQEPALLTYLRFGPKAAILTEGTEETADGTAYTVSLTGTLPKPAAALLNWLARHQARRWVVIWRDGNNAMWVAGDPDNGLRLSWTRQNAGPNNLTISLTGRSYHPAWPIDADSIEAMFPLAEFDASFDLTFTS